MTIMKHVTLQKILAHDFRYDPRMLPDVCMRSEKADLREIVKMSLPFKYRLHLSRVLIRRHNAAQLQLVLSPATYLEARTRLSDGLEVIHGTQNSSNSIFRLSSYSNVKITAGNTSHIVYSFVYVYSKII